MIMKLDVNLGEKPLWSQLYDILIERIQTGYYKVGDTMPPEMQLMEEFGVSRITVRQAMDKLLSEKQISRRRGKGTVVLEKQDKIETTFKSVFNGVHERNNNTDRRVVSLKYCIPPVEVAYFFGTAHHQEVLMLVRDIYVEQRKVANHITYLHPSVPIKEDDDLSVSLYQKLEMLDFKINRVKEKISASITTAEDKKVFNINKNDAVINRIRMGYANNNAIEYTYSKYLSDGYELTIDLS